MRESLAKIRSPNSSFEIEIYSVGDFPSKTYRADISSTYPSFQKLDLELAHDSSTRDSLSLVKQITIPEFKKSGFKVLIGYEDGSKSLKDFLFASPVDFK